MPNSFPAEYKTALLHTLDTIDLERVEAVINLLRQARQEGRTVFVCGNGGSWATAAHFVCDMVKGASYNQPCRFRIMTLGGTLPTLTAYSNDVNYDSVFVEELKNFARPGDVLIAISGSGNSPNVLRAIEYARSARCHTVALTGRDGGKLGPLADIEIRVPEPHMGRIEDAHMIVCHMICYHFMDRECVQR